jgi:glyoxylase-like metal-dependent hydrolase (beta-lactamase superfamily II)/rhodanese-related sulfurtransferase
MYIQQIYTNCLAEAAYYIESDGEAAIVDPIRETEPYTQLAEQRNSKINYIFETHFHADFVSGHIDLSKKTGAEIIYGPEANTNYKVKNAKDGETFKVGKITIKVLHTPGHTLESSCFLLLDENQNPYCVFTGDTLFVGDVGRPDLLDGSGISKEYLAGLLFESLHQKIKPLPDGVIVYPAHGPGSSCGKNIGKETWSTIGQQKQSNYYLKETDKGKFIETLTTGILPPPLYFFDDARINKMGYAGIDEVVSKNTRPLSLSDFEKIVSKGAIMLDTRSTDDFEKGFIPGALNIGLNGQYAQWLGTLITIDKPIVLITETGKEKESVLRAARVGYENIKGYLEGGMDTYIKAAKPLDEIASIDASAFHNYLKAGNYTALDVRKPGEFETAHVQDAEFISLSDLPASYHLLQKEKTYLVYCGGGYRSMIAASLLKANGFKNIMNVYGGFGKIKGCGVPIVAEQLA